MSKNIGVGMTLNKRVYNDISQLQNAFVCFPYGIEIEEKHNKGKAYRLEIIN